MLWLIVFMACLAAWFVTRRGWLIGLALVAGAPFMWLNLKRRWRNI
jgi:hypothetical protein